VSRFEYHAPGAVAEAVDLAARYGDAARFLAARSSPFLTPCASSPAAESTGGADTQNVPSCRQPGRRQRGGAVGEASAVHRPPASWRKGPEGDDSEESGFILAMLTCVHGD